MKFCNECFHRIVCTIPERNADDCPHFVSTDHIEQMKKQTVAARHLIRHAQNGARALLDWDADRGGDASVSVMHELNKKKNG